MRTLRQTSQFKKDLKHIQNDSSKIKHLKEVLCLLQDEIPLPKKYKAHSLAGNYKGCMECHVENDSLLIWIDSDSDIIKLVRFGSHSQLFG